ncbi:hypothetical protein MNBD_BACTEROID05-179, partial [hydrothermal vent metagenome]
MINFFLKNKTFFFFGLFLIAGTIILFPYLDYQSFLSQGDHGRDLLAFEMTAQGAIPYQDYWWVYGPLMPYYYAFFIKIFGVSMTSVLLGKILLLLASGGLFYFILSAFISPVISLAGALWFLLFHEDFFFTYNHPGGITLTLATTLCISLYLKNQKSKYLLYAFPIVLALSLIKLNFGLTALAMIVFSTFLTNRYKTPPPPTNQKYFYFLFIGLLPVAIIGIYMLFLNNLPIHVIRQCLPYLSSDHPNKTPVIQSLLKFSHSIFLNATGSWPNLLFATLILVSLSITLTTAIRKKNINILLGLLFFSTFYIFNLHEYLVSGVYYRTFWAQPFSYLIMFLALGSLSTTFPKHIKFIFSTLILALALFFTIRMTSAITTLKTKLSPMKIRHSKIYLRNKPQWIETVNSTSSYLQLNLTNEETFFALPYDPLYYYLTDKKTPTRQTIFFEHINIPPAQEIKIIKDLEKNRINWILISNRMNSQDVGLGLLGVSYCPLIGKYIDQNF